MRVARVLSRSLLIVSMAVPAAAQAPAVFTTEDMLEVRGFAPGQPASVSPDGRRIAYVLTDLDEEGNTAVGYVHVQSLEGGQTGAPRALTSGRAHSAYPVWSPDGGKLAYFAQGATPPGGAGAENEGYRLTVWEAATATATAFGDALPSPPAFAPQWDAAGSTVVIAVPEPRSAPAPKPRVIVVESTDRRLPGDAFFTNDRRARLVALDIGARAPARPLTDAVMLRSFRVAPAGDGVVYIATTPETAGLIGTKGRPAAETSETFVVSMSSGAPRRISAGDGARVSWMPDGDRLLFARNGRLFTVGAGGGNVAPYLEQIEVGATDPIWSPDGRRFVTLVADPAIEDPEIEKPQPGMYTIAQPFWDLHLVDVGRGASRNLTGGLDDRVSDPAWSPDGRSVFFRAVDNATYNESLYRYVMDEGRLEVVRTGAESYGSISAGGAVVAATVETATSPRDLWLFDPARPGEARRITSLNPQLSRFRFSTPELFHYHNADGERLGALLYRPAGVPPDQPVPVVTWVYEKLTPGIHQFNARFQMVLNHGYAMLLPNVKVKTGETADSFVGCVVPAVNAVRAMGFTNGRFGIWGHSFGAYATSNLITRTGIFAAAVSGATPPELFRNWASGRDRDSRNIETGQARMGGTPFDYPERYRSQSAFFHLDKVTTPVLILHGEQDYTILFGEGEMMFAALRQLGKTATFVIYPYGDHGLTRRVKSDILDVNRRILEWFDRYLKAPATRASGPDDN